MQKIFPLVCSLILFLTLPACFLKRNGVSHILIKNNRIPIFIEMPRNELVFDHASPIVYESLYRQFARVGYRMVDDQSKGYTLHVSIKKLDPHIKLVSPDIILLHYHIKAEIFCLICDFNGQIVVQKTFFFSSLISKPRNPILNSDFVDFEYKRLFERLAPKIENFFRPYLLDAFK